MEQKGESSNTPSITQRTLIRRKAFGNTYYIDEANGKVTQKGKHDIILDWETREEVFSDEEFQQSYGDLETQEYVTQIEWMKEKFGKLTTTEETIEIFNEMYREKETIRRDDPRSEKLAKRLMTTITFENEQSGFLRAVQRIKYLEAFEKSEGFSKDTEDIRSVHYSSGKEEDYLASEEEGDSSKDDSYEDPEGSGEELEWTISEERNPIKKKGKTVNIELDVSDVSWSEGEMQRQLHQQLGIKPTEVKEIKKVPKKTMTAEEQDEYIIRELLDEIK
jgi:hypothetical protein